MLEFNPYDFETFRDPYPTYRRLRDKCPVYHNESLKFWSLSRFADVLAAHNDWERFSSSGRRDDRGDARRTARSSS